jgi:hypothetical protein
MPITLAQMAMNTADVTLSYGNQSVTIAYYPSRITEKTFAQLKSFANSDVDTMMEGFASLNELIVHVVKSWDVFEDEGQTQMFPLDVERLAELPIAFRLQTINAIMKDIKPGEIVALQA